MKFKPKDMAGHNLAELLSALEADELSISGEVVELYSTIQGQIQDFSTGTTTLMLSNLQQDNIPPDVTKLELPDLIIDTFVGAGAQGCVYTARMRQSNHIVAVKLIHQDSVEMPEQLKREVGVPLKVHHRNILRVFHCQKAGEYWLMVMELIRGQTLPSGGYTCDELRPCARQICQALLSLWQNQFVHCDIKPTNIMVRADDFSPVIVDFGLAQDLTDLKPMNGISGTPYYMAPEVFHDQLPSPAWDAYALGVTASVCIIGNQFRNRNIDELLQAKVSGRFDDDLLERLSGVSTPMTRWIGDLISRNPQIRVDAVARAANWSNGHSLSP